MQYVVTGEGKERKRKKGSMTSSNVHMYHVYLSPSSKDSNCPSIC